MPRFVSVLVGCVNRAALPPRQVHGLWTSLLPSSLHLSISLSLHSLSFSPCPILACIFLLDDREILQQKIICEEKTSLLSFQLIVDCHIAWRNYQSLLRASIFRLSWIFSFFFSCMSFFLLLCFLFPDFHNQFTLFHHGDHYSMINCALRIKSKIIAKRVKN